MSTRVAITLSDPWELVTVCGDAPLKGTVRDVGKESILVELDKPLSYGGQNYPFARCQLRHEGTTIDDLLSPRETPTAIVLIPTNMLSGESPSRRGLIALGGVRRLS